MGDIKTSLKEAREAVKNKDYQGSLRLCKSILKREKDNYMALVLLGISLQEVGPKDQAPKAFKKAIQANKINPLAWNGLANYYETVDTSDSKCELLKIYMTLLDVEPSENKLMEYCNKLANLSEYGDIGDIAMAIYKLTESSKCSESALVDICVLLAGMFLKIKDLSKEFCHAYEKTLAFIVSNKNTVTIDYYATFLTLLYKQNKTVDLLTQARKMHNTYETDKISLNWICKVYNEAFVEDREISNEELPDISSFCDVLMLLEPQSSMALFTKSIFAIKESKINEAKDLLKTVTDLRPGLLHVRVLQAECYMTLSMYEDALHAITRADKLLQSVHNSNEVLRKKIDVLLIQIKSRCIDSDSWEEVIEMYNKVLSSSSDDIPPELDIKSPATVNYSGIIRILKDDGTKTLCFPDFIRANINLEKYAEAKLLIDQSRKGAHSSDTLDLLMAQLFRRQKRYPEALKILEEKDVQLSEWWFEIGLIYWDLEDDKKCLIALLKAAKYGPQNYVTFRKLGDYYQKVKKFDSARRCYERAFNLNQNCPGTVIELSKMYRNLEMWDENMSLLETLTAEPISRGNCWAYLQLGLNCLEQGNYPKAIESLRYVIRIDEDSVHCWESLADAYLARGAYTSALKSYERAAELSEDPLYSLLQIATIKKILGNYSEANEDFQTILLDNEGYVPALKGLAETYLRQAYQCFRDQRLGNVRDYCQSAVDKITVAIQQKRELSCLWKIMADSCLFVARLPVKYCFMHIPASLVLNDADDGDKLVKREELFSFATRCYSSAVGLMEENTLLWHDLSTCFLWHALHTENNTEKTVLLKKSFSCAQHCTMKNPTHFQHWNLLGNIALHYPENYSIAQHCFIKAVTINHNFAVAWCNLGTLYLTLNNIKLANEAFSMAQRSDPSYVNSWIGQALIAEALQHPDAMDLFRHSTQLGAHQQGGIGYGHWVCKTLLQSPPDAVSYAIHNMHAIPVACDALTWYTEKNPHDSCAWNMLGILRERLGLKLTTAEAFSKAINFSTQEHVDACRTNYGRMLAKLGEYPKAIHVLSDVSAATFSSGSGLALALFKNKQYEESYEAYNQALDWLTQEESKQSDLLVALASIAYMFQGKDAARDLLFQSIKLKPPSPWALYATLSLALLHEDFKIGKLILKEMENFKDNKEWLPHYALLLSYFHLLQGNNVKVVREVSKLVHRHPDQASLWLTLSIVLLHLHQVRPASAASKCASAAMKLGQTHMDVTKVICLEALGSYLIGNYKQALIAAQKAIHYYPTIPEGWAILIATLRLCKSKVPFDREHTAKVILFIQKLSPSMKLMEWLMNQDVGL